MGIGFAPTNWLHPCRRLRCHSKRRYGFVRWAPPCFTWPPYWLEITMINIVTSTLASRGSLKLSSVSDERRLAARRRAIVWRRTIPTPSVSRLSSSLASPPVNSARISVGTSLFTYVCIQYVTQLVNHPELLLKPDHHAGHSYQIPHPGSVTCAMGIFSPNFWFIGLLRAFVLRGAVNKVTP